MRGRPRKHPRPPKFVVVVPDGVEMDECLCHAIYNYHGAPWFLDVCYDADDGLRYGATRLDDGRTWVMACPVEAVRRRRRAIPARVRESVFTRYGRACMSCGSPDQLQMDHIKPWSKGGTDDPDNLQPLCFTCNVRKRDRWEAATV